VLLQFFAETDVEAADHEEENGDSDVNEVRHGFFKLSEAGAPEIESDGSATARVMHRPVAFPAQPGN
jgi:hypothetical protein